MRIANEWSDTEAGSEVQAFEAAFTSNGRLELDTRNGNASAVKRALHYSVVMKRELPKTGKALNFQNSFCPQSHLWS